MRWLFDTNVVSEVIRPRPNPTVLSWIASRPEDTVAISTITIAELREGASLVQNETRRKALREWIDVSVERDFGDRALPLTVEILTTWLSLARSLKANGRSASSPDLLIAATARVHDLTIATRNVRDFVGTGAILFNPWTGDTTQMDNP